MLSRLREHFGTAGLIVAIVALIAALGGGAYAASSGAGGGKATASAAKGKPGPRGKTGKTGPAGPAGPAGPQGPAGPAGAKGDAGAAGANGKDGTNGTPGTPGTPGAAGKSAVVTPFDSETEPAGEPCNEFGGAEVEVEGSGEPANVCNGETGFTETLPEGKTETGAWGGSVGAGEFTPVPVSFAIPLAVEVEAHLRPLNATPDTNCPGTSLDPQAAPGHLCVYLGQKSGSAAFALAVEPAAGGPAGFASTAGALVSLEGPPGQYAGGTFAVTAPPPAP
jgi:hypothetical protein